MRSVKEQKMILKAAAITSFITTFMGSALNLSIPGLENQFHVSAALIGWVVTAYTLSVAALSVPMGKIADATGRRRILITGISAFSVICILCAFAPNIWILLVLRVVQGFAAAMIFATNNAILISAYPESQRGRVLGISTAAVYIGLSAGPVVGGFLNHYFDWQSIFVCSAFVALVSLTFALKGIPKGDEIFETSKPDVPGNILYMASITVTLYGLANISALRFGWVIMVCGIMLGVAFVAVELKAENPVIRVTMFSEDAVFTLSNIASLLNYGATFAISYLMSIYLQVVMGYSSQTAGLILIAQPVVQAVFSPMMGRLSDKIEPYKLATTGMAICALGLVFFSTVAEGTRLWQIIAALIFSGFGFALFSSPNTNAILACVEKKDYSIANSILTTMRTVGHSSSMAIVTIVVGMTLGNKSLTAVQPAELIHTMHISFIIFVVLCVLGTLMSLKRRNTAV